MKEYSEELIRKHKKENRIILISVLIVVLLYLGIAMFAILDKSNSYHIDVNNPNLIETKYGYKEILVIEETEIIKKYEKKHRPSGQRVSRKQYNIIFYNEEIQDNMEINVEKKKYDELEVGDKIKVTREIYYTKNGLRLEYKDFVEKIEASL